MTTTMRYATFVVRGAHLTAQSRELMGTGDWKNALELLTDALEGMTYEQAIGVIEGQYKLTGEGSTIMMEPEDAEVAKALQEQYKDEYEMGQYVKRGNWFYEPYLVIDNVGENDVAKILLMPEYKDTGTQMFTASQRHNWLFVTEVVHRKTCWANFSRQVLLMRAMHYAKSPESDFAELLTNANGKDVLVLFHRVPSAETPFWRTKDAKDPQCSFSYLENYIPAGGHAQRYGEQHPSMREQPVAPTPVEPTAAEREEARQELAAELEAQQVREEAKLAEAQALTERIRAFADADTEYGWQNYSWLDKESGKRLQLRAPRRALLCYALSRTAASHQMPVYKAFSPDSFKTADDDQYHTDVWLGCGLSLDSKTYVHSSPEYRAVLDMMFEVQREMLNFEVQVLARGPSVFGTVVYADHPNIDKTCILVVPHAGVEFELQAMKAGAVITEAGGRLAHLVTVCREMDKPILRMDDACKKLRSGQQVSVNPAEGKIQIHPGK